MVSEPLHSDGLPIAITSMEKLYIFCIQYGTFVRSITRECFILELSELCTFMLYLACMEVYA